MRGNGQRKQPGHIILHPIHILSMRPLLCSGLSIYSRLPRRTYTTTSTSLIEHAALDQWIDGSSTRQLVLKDRLSPEHLSDLFITLPTRDGTRQPYNEAKPGDPLPYGHHLAFFHPRTPEKYLRPDGTDADFCPPEPFVRRMWAGGKIRWEGGDGMRIGESATSKSTIKQVEKKGFETGSPMVFVKQHIQISSGGSMVPQVEEERSHVYLGLGVNKRSIRPGMPGNGHPRITMFCSSVRMTTSDKTTTFAVLPHVHTKPYNALPLFGLDIQRSSNPS